MGSILTKVNNAKNQQIYKSKQKEREKRNQRLRPKIQKLDFLSTQQVQKCLKNEVKEDIDFCNIKQQRSNETTYFLKIINFLKYNCLYDSTFVFKNVTPFSLLKKKFPYFSTLQVLNKIIDDQKSYQLMKEFVKGYKKLDEQKKNTQIKKVKQSKKNQQSSILIFLIPIFLIYLIYLNRNKIKLFLIKIKNKIITKNKKQNNSLFFVIILFFILIFVLNNQSKTKAEEIDSFNNDKFLEELKQIVLIELNLETL